MWGDLTAVPSTYEKHREDRARFFIVACRGKMRDNRLMEKQDGFRVDIRRNFFPYKDSSVVKEVSWEIVQFPSLEFFKI